MFSFPLSGLMTQPLPSTSPCEDFPEEQYLELLFLQGNERKCKGLKTLSTFRSHVDAFYCFCACVTTIPERHQSKQCELKSARDFQPVKANKFSSKHLSLLQFMANIYHFSVSSRRPNLRKKERKASACVFQHTQKRSHKNIHQ